MSNSDWSQTIKPVASKLYLELSKSHGEQVGAFVEALEIARRHAEIHQTEKDWRKRWGHDLDRAKGNLASKDYLQGGNLLAASGNLFKSLCEEFGSQRAVHILTGIDREHTRARWGTDLKSWRERGEITRESAASYLGISVEDIDAIEGGNFSAGPEAMRLIRPALRKVRDELENKQSKLESKI